MAIGVTTRNARSRPDHVGHRAAVEAVERSGLAEQRVEGPVVRVPARLACGMRGAERDRGADAESGKRVPGRPEPISVDYLPD